MIDVGTDIYGEKQSERLARKAKESPFMMAGLVGLGAVLAGAAYKYRTQGVVRPDIYLMKVRVAASGTIFAACMIGATLQISKDLMNVKVKK